MARKTVSPIMTWAFWSIVVFGAFLTVTWEFFVAGFSADTSKITWIIMIFFVLGMWFSLRAALHLEREFKSLKAMDADQRIGDANSSDVAALFDAAMERVRRGDRIEPRNLVSAYGAKLRAQVENVGVIAAMLITSGLLGTVVGLIITISGLDTVLQSNSADFAAMKMGLNRTVSGMGTAFSTTFFGGLLGGVVLKVLGSELKKSVSLLVADTLRFSELFITPQFSRKSSESLVELETRITRLQEQFSTLDHSFGSVIETLDSRQTALASGMDGLAAAVQHANSRMAEQSMALVDVVDEKMDETNRLADERLQAITASLAQSGEDANARISALVESIQQTVEATGRQADERLNVLLESVARATEEAGARTNELGGAIQQAVEETNRLADERLNALLASVSRATEETGARTSELAGAVTQTVEETNRLADERLKLIAENLDQASQHAENRMLAVMERIGMMVDDTHSKADERLATLSDTIHRTTDETHRLADERTQVLMKALETAAQQTHEKSEAHLIRFVQSVDQAMDQSRKHAERSLHAKASHLAGKLNEAASALAGLAELRVDTGKEGGRSEGE